MSTAARAARVLFGTPFSNTIQQAADLSRGGTYRWTLTRTWSTDSGHACFIGLNRPPAGRPDGSALDPVRPTLASDRL